MDRFIATLLCKLLKQVPPLKSNMDRFIEEIEMENTFTKNFKIQYG